MVNPIYVDKPVRPNDYKSARAWQLLVTNIFATVQGEGPFRGQRAIFLRLAGCNYGGKGVTGAGCDFCDTSFEFSKGTWMGFDDIEAQCIEKVIKNFDNITWPVLLVITGGEPGLQRNLLNFCVRVSPDKFKIQIETNGVYPRDYPNHVYVVFSPKVPVDFSKPDRVLGYPRFTDKHLEKADCLKLLVSADPSSPYHEIPNFAFRMQRMRKPVMVSPINAYQSAFDPGQATMWKPEYYDIEQCKANHAYATQLAMQHGFVVSMQMHLWLGIP